MRKISEFNRKSVLWGQDHGAEEPTRKVWARNGCKISDNFAREQKTQENRHTRMEELRQSLSVKGVFHIFKLDLLGIALDLTFEQKLFI